MDKIIDKVFSDKFAAVAQMVISGLIFGASLIAAIFVAPWQWLIALISWIMLVSGIMECRRIGRKQPITTNNTNHGESK